MYLSLWCMRAGDQGHTLGKTTMLERWQGGSPSLCHSWLCRLEEGVYPIRIFQPMAEPEIKTYWRPW